ncbi:MAG: thiamine diphosphokinase [Firmicutes bacterium]|nr:thiamine diphosphokinase [Bacillota bacterium]
MSMQDELYVSSGPCLIVGGAKLDEEWARQYVAEIPQAMTIAADSGIDFFYNNGRKCPDLFIGDYDSADPGMVDYYADKEQTLKMTLPTHKDWTDSEKSLMTAIEANCDPIHLIGMTGGRLDHTLGNIQMLRRAADAHVHAYLADPYSRTLMVAANDADPETGVRPVRRITLNREKAYGKYFSLIAAGGPVTGLTVTGAQYNVADAVLAGDSSLGVSNEFAEDEVHISFDSGYLLIVESRDYHGAADRAGC